jgi:hypothetical protein
MNISTAKEQIKIALSAKWPVLLIGQPGIGKTDLCVQTARESGMDFLFEVATTADPTDVRGLPSVIDGKAAYLPYGFLRQLIEASKPTLALIDDLGHASPEVQKSFMHLLLARRINEHKVSDYVSFITATNNVGQKAGVNSVISPLQNRVCHLHIEPDPEDWCKWALKNEVHPAVISFVKSNPKIFEDWEPPVGIQACCTPRSLKMLSDFLNCGARTLPSFEGCVGSNTAIHFMSYLDIYETLPTVRELLHNPETFEFPTKLDHQYALCSALSCETSKESWDIITKYFKDKKVPIELQVMTITDATIRERSVLKLESIVKWMQQNKKVLL